jgi:hypothetical protein
MEHLLRTGRNGCTPTFTAEEKIEVQQVLIDLDADVTRKREKVQRSKGAVHDLTMSDRPRKQQRLGFASQGKDALDMKYTRLIVMTNTKTTFMESEFVKDFCDSFNYSPPSRATVMGPLLDHLYNDTLSKVKAALHLKDPDSLFTICMDGWVAPTGEHVRNYMFITDTATFYWCGKPSGTTRPTGVAIGTECNGVIADAGSESCAAVANDNASAETTSWDTIREVNPHVLCTGDGGHGGTLLFASVCELPWAASIIEKATTMAKFFKSHTWTCAEVKERAAVLKMPGAIILHGATRFAGVYYLLSRLLLLKPILRQVVVSQGFIDMRYTHADDIEAMCNNPQFWKLMDNLRLFMKPLKCFIKLCDHQCNTTEHLYPGEQLEHDPDPDPDTDPDPYPNPDPDLPPPPAPQPPPPPPPPGMYPFPPQACTLSRRRGAVLPPPSPCPPRSRTPLSAFTRRDGSG